MSVATVSDVTVNSVQVGLPDPAVATSGPTAALTAAVNYVFDCSKVAAV